MYTIPGGLNLAHGRQTEWTTSCVIASLSLDPAAIFIFFQRQLVQGIAGTGLK
jgi:ABC-type glycerol-3-phosphate transport system permease component